MSIEIIFTDQFRRNVRKLGKRYRRIRLDIQPLIEQLESGQLPGDQISDIGFVVFKVRVKNSDIQKGKSGGYRLIYYLKMNDQILFVTMYSKSDQSDIDVSEIREIILDAETQLTDSEADSVETSATKQDDD